jgi:hypothetical protein
MSMQNIRVVAFAIVCMFAGVAPAGAFPGGGMGGMGGMGGIGGGSIKITPGIGGGLPAANVASMAPVFDRPQRIRDHLDVTGLVGISEKKLVSNGPIVRLRLDGRDIPMRLDTELDGVVLQFDLNENYARDLYQSLLTKSIVVVGQRDLRDQIAQAADKWKPLVVEGYVFGRASPFFVVKSVKAE